MRPAENSITAYSTCVLLSQKSEACGLNYIRMQTLATAITRKDGFFSGIETICSTGMRPSLSCDLIPISKTFVDLSLGLRVNRQARN